MKHPFLALALVLAVLCPVSVFAQTPTVEAGAPFQVVADHDGVGVVGVPGAGYRLIVDGTPAGDVQASALVKGVVTLPLAGVDRGDHTVAIEAFNPDGVARSETLAFAAAYPTPSTPSLPRVLAVTIASDGTLTFKALTLAQLQAQSATP